MSCELDEPYQRNKINKVNICKAVAASADLQHVPSSKSIQSLQYMFNNI